MSENKDKFIQDFKGLLFQEIPTENIASVIDLVAVALKDFDLQYKETSVVVYDHGDKKIFQNFFVAKAVEGLSQNSLTYYNTIISGFLHKTCKHINDITTDDIRVYLALKKINKSSDNTLNNIRRVLSSFFSWCASEGLVERNPTLRIKGIRQIKKMRKSLSEEEMEQLRYAATTKRNLAIIEFLFSTGCRVSEAVSINKADVDIVGGQVDVLGKGRKYRTVYLSARCKMSLTEYLHSRTDNLEPLFVSDWENFKNKEKINSSPVRISKSAIESMLRKIGKNTGIENVHPHRFRRTAATLALKRGMPIEQVQRLLGHESIQTTTIYAMSTNDELKLSHEKYII